MNEKTPTPKPRVRNQSELATAIEDLVWKKDISYLEATLLYCEINNLEIESVAAAIKLNSNLRGKLHLEAQELNFIEKTSKLPV